MLLWANDFRAVFWAAVVPGLLSVAVLLFGVQEPARPAASGTRINPLRWRELNRLSGEYWWVVAIGAVFTLARFSEAFLVLRAYQVGLPIVWVPLVLVAMNVVYALSACSPRDPEKSQPTTMNPSLPSIRSSMMHSCQHWPSLMFP